MADTENNGTSVPETEEKYIRTFTGDMIVARKGGTPDLTPYEEHKKLLTETPPPPLPVETEKKEIPKPAPKPVEKPQPVWNEQVREVTKARLRAQIEQDEAAGVHRSTEHSHPIGIEEKDEKAEPLRTYANDFSDHVKEQGASTFSVLAAEQDSGSRSGVVEESPLRKKIYVGVGLAFFLVGGIGVYIGYTTYRDARAPVYTAPVVVAPIFVEESEEVVGQGAALQTAIVSSVSKSLPTNSVRFLYSANATTTRDSIFVTAQITAPDILRRNIIGSGSMVGVLTSAGETSPFFILSVTAYNNTFAGMLAWEETITRDLMQFFRAHPAPVVYNEPIATTTESVASSTGSVVVELVAPEPVFKAGFYDEVVANHDVRVYKDDQERVVLVYGYWNEKTLIIARNTEAFAELAGRLARSQSQR